MPHVLVDGLTMYYEVHGEGDDLLVIPGLSLDVSEIQYIIEGLSVQYRVTTFDNRGAGRTDQPVGPYSIPMMANDTIGLLDALGISSARVVGISMGAKIAMEMSIRYPNRVSALVLVGAQYRPRTKMRLSLLMTAGMWVKKLGFAKGRYPQSDQAFAAQRGASLSYGCDAELSQIGATTVILHGRKDRTAPYEQALEMVQRIPNATLRTFRGGHLFFLMRERDLFVQAVLDTGASAHGA